MIAERVVGRVADHLAALAPADGVLRVGVDGITAAGKTTFADALATQLSARGVPVIRVSMDGFHHPRAHRYRLGRASAEGYYRDAYDFPAVTRVLLEPLGPGGSLRYRTGVIHLAADTPRPEEWHTAAPGSVLVVDGSFLQRELSFDEVVFLDASFDAARARGMARDSLPASAFRERYHAACELYLGEVSPSLSASVVVESSNPFSPELVRIGSGALLFSYGTLQLPAVQEATFGRVLDGRPAVVLGHELAWLTITDPAVVATSGTDRHPVVSPGSGTVSGSVLSLSGSELAAADLYEVDDYRRRLVDLEDGGQAWMYLATPTIR